MSELDRERKVERIVVAFDTTPLEEAALEAAVALASALDAELSGVYVEDVNLVRIAALPFTRELGLASAAIRPLEPFGMERALRLQAGRSREQLAAVASAFDLRWSFQVVRGQVLAAVLECVREADLVVLGKAGRGITARSATLPTLGRALAVETQREGGRFKRLNLRSVALLFDGTPRAWRALAAAYALAATARTRLALLVPARSREEFEQMREAVRAWLGERGATACFNWLRSSEVSEVAAGANAEDAAALLWYDRTLLQQSRCVDALLAALCCPLVLIN